MHGLGQEHLVLVVCCRGPAVLAQCKGPRTECIELAQVMRLQRLLVRWPGVVHPLLLLLLKPVLLHCLLVAGVVLLPR